MALPHEASPTWTKDQICSLDSEFWGYAALPNCNSGIWDILVPSFHFRLVFLKRQNSLEIFDIYNTGCCKYHTLAMMPEFCMSIFSFLVHFCMNFIDILLIQTILHCYIAPVCFSKMAAMTLGTNNNPKSSSNSSFTKHCTISSKIKDSYLCFWLIKGKRGDLQFHNSTSCILLYTILKKPAYQSSSLYIKKATINSYRKALCRKLFFFFFFLLRKKVITLFYQGVPSTLSTQHRHA